MQARIKLILEALILSAEMMLRHMGWVEAADLIISFNGKNYWSKKVTYDFESDDGWR